MRSTMATATNIVFLFSFLKYFSSFSAVSEILELWIKIWLLAESFPDRNSGSYVHVLVLGTYLNHQL